MGSRQLGSRRAGFTLIEVMVAVVLLSVAMLGFSRAVVSSMIASDTDRGVRMAAEASRSQLETLLGSDFSQVFALYNDNPADDPGGVGTAPGSTFDVEGLDVQDGDADGQVGKFLLPFVQKAGIWELREDLDLPELGLPRDLSGDGIIDDQDHSTDYVLLPARVRIDWQGAGSPAHVQFHTVLMGL
ncbi:MAG: prepilin-type N-terminal cleavage/methylation domain-containing protein [Chlamydiales bacterium]|jgi:prepilin-type N-terminal cleavage/methylation domain-containing protein